MARKEPAKPSGRTAAQTRRKAGRKRQQAKRAAREAATLRAELAAMGGVYALVGGYLLFWDADGKGPYGMLDGEEFQTRVERLCKRKGRVYATMEEAEFVLFGRTPGTPNSS